MTNINLPSYLKPLHEPFLNDIQKALMNAYLAWSGEREPSWIRICSMLRNFANMLPGATKDSIAKYLINNGWSEEPCAYELYNLMDKYTKHVRSGSFQHFLSNVKPDDIKPPKLSAEQERILSSEMFKLKVVDRPLIRMSLAQKSCYVMLRTQQQNIVLELDEKTLMALRNQLNGTIKSLETE